MRSSTTGSSAEASVSPVPVSFRPDEGGDVAREHFLDLGALVGMHLEHPPDALAMVLRRVLHHVAGFQRAGIDAHEGERAVFVVDDLEGEAGERGAPDRP